jgi:hypothetical protein
MGWLFEMIPTGLTLTEAAGGKLTARGLFGICGVPTANGRIYPKKLVEREIGRLGERMKNRQVLMQLDHPSDGKASLLQAAALLTGLDLDGDNVMGEAEILGTPNGKILRALIEAQVKVGVSSRGFGSTKATNEGEEVGEDFALASYDFVADPSVRTALPKFYAESVEAPAEEAPLELFQREFPEAFAQLTEAATRDAVARAQEQTAAIIAKAVETERTRVRDEMTEAFEHQLRDAVVGLREDLERDLREEYERDPAVAGARAALAQVVEMIRPYQQAPDADAVRDALRARELELATAHEATAQAEERAARSDRLLALETKLAGHPLADPLRKVLAPVVARERDEGLAGRLDDLIAEAADMVPASEVEARAAERIALTEAQDLIKENEQKRSQLAERVDELKAKLVEAVKLGQEADGLRAEAEQRAEEAEAKLDEGEAEVDERELAAFKRGAAAILPAGARARKLIEAAGDEAEVEQVLVESRAQAMGDGDLEQARQAVRGRGMAPGAAAFRLEEGASRGGARGSDEVVSATGLTANDMTALLGDGQ